MLPTLFNEYIDRRLLNDIISLRETKEWKNKERLYFEKSNYLFENLNSNLCDCVVELINLKQGMLLDEIYLAYKTGLIDGIELKENS